MQIIVLSDRTIYIADAGKALLYKDELQKYPEIVLQNQNDEDIKEVDIEWPTVKRSQKTVLR